MGRPYCCSIVSFFLSPCFYRQTPSRERFDRFSWKVLSNWNSKEKKNRHFRHALLHVHASVIDTQMLVQSFLLSWVLLINITLILILIEKCIFKGMFVKTLVSSYFSHIVDLYIQGYNPDRFPLWCDSDPPDSCQDTVWNSSLRNTLVLGNLIIRNTSNG